MLKAIFKGQESRKELEVEITTGDIEGHIQGSGIKEGVGGRGQGQGRDYHQRC